MIDLLIIIIIVLNVMNNFELKFPMNTKCSHTHKLYRYDREILSL